MTLATPLAHRMVLVWRRLPVSAFHSPPLGYWHALASLLRTLRR